MEVLVTFRPAFWVVHQNAIQQPELTDKELAFAHVMSPKRLG